MAAKKKQITPEALSSEVKELEAAAAEGVPVYIVRADSPFGIQSMIAIARLAEGKPEQAVTASALREFELYEEANRG